MEVHKFGGAALRDGPAILHVAGILRAESTRTTAARPSPGIVAVVSALEGVTDRLAGAVERVQEDAAHIALIRRELEDQHYAALDAVAPQDAAARETVKGLLLRLERLLYGLAETSDATPRAHDLVLSFGERLAAPIVAAALTAVGIHAEPFDAERAGIRSRGPHANADPDMARLRVECQAALTAALDAGVLPVVTGFYGVDSQGHATLFGRGGSDYVAALVADAMDAQAVHLWKDVPGFLSADPRLVPGARLLSRIAYEEAAELSQFGARVLHPRAVEPAQAKGIPIHVRDVRSPASAGTIIARAPSGPPPGPRAVSCLDGVALLRLHGPGLAAQAGVAQRVFEAIPGINVLAVANSQTTLTLVVAEGDAAKGHRLLVGLGGAVRDVEAIGNQSLICVVGRGQGDPAAAAQVLSAVAAAQTTISMMGVPGNDVALDFVVPTRDASAVVQTIHARLVSLAGSAALGPDVRAAKAPSAMPASPQVSS